MNRIEKRIIELIPELEERVHAADLYAEGYEPKHNSMRKQVENLEIVYRESANGLFRFAALIRREDAIT